MQKLLTKLKNWRNSKVLAVVSAVILVGLSFYGGFLLGHHGAQAKDTQQNSGQAATGQILNLPAEQPAYLAKDADFKLFSELIKIIHSHYYKKGVGDTQLFYGALSGMVASLKDPYSVFLAPDLSARFTQELSGSFEGIGAEVGVRKDRLTVIAPLAGTPAALAGLKSGDWIIAINKHDTTDLSVYEAVNLIRGQKGTKVELSVIREGVDQALNFSIVRDTIKIASVSWEKKDNGIAYIKISHFNEDTYQNFSQIIPAILETKPRGLVLDLRDNPGGFLNVAIDVAGEWIAGKPIVIEKYSDTQEDTYGSEVASRLAKLKTVILVNGGSASGSEIVAGALQDYQAATLVGEKTFGKGSVQDLTNLSDGSSVKLTIAKWLTPLRRAIDEIGIKPDYEVKLTAEDLSNNRDPQLDKALQLLR